MLGFFSLAAGWVVGFCAVAAGAAVICCSAGVVVVAAGGAVTFGESTA